MLRHEIANDGETDAGSGDGRRGRGRQPGIRLPDPRTRIRRHARSLIVNRDHRRIAAAIDADGDRSDPDRRT